ncbi:right origin-binding protein [Salmonella enterica subsp. enterica]|uniref:Right origin-binding protein n=1 Tax=Salmonella enterica I TaxID=59201 RepID=A0A379X0I8_SALET|nr:right origin-binding protein [Salmonella enterica subsp. enterica]
MWRQKQAIPSGTCRECLKDVTGHALALTLRARRLSKSAVALRLTARPILDIALQYRFDSQQTFTRAFKKQFSRRQRCIVAPRNGAPLAFARHYGWASLPVPEHQFVTLEDTRSLASRRAIPARWNRFPTSATKCACNSGMISSVIRQLFRQCFMGLMKRAPAWEKDDEQEVFYTTALPQEQADGYVQSAHPVLLQGGEYVMFTYEGLGTGVQDFILTVYGTCMPMLNLTRRKGQDIERYYPSEDTKTGDSPYQPALRISDPDSPLTL